MSLQDVVLLLCRGLGGAVLLTEAWCLFRHLTGWLGKGGWLAADRKASRWCLWTLDLMLLSNAVRWGIAAPGERLWAELAFGAACLAAVILHVGGRRSSKIPDSVRRHKVALGVVVAALLPALLSFVLCLGRLGRH